MSSTSRRPDLHWSLPAKLQYIQPPKTRLIRNAANYITANDQRSVQANIVKRERYLSKLMVTNCIMTIPPCLRHKIQFCENSLLIYTQTPPPPHNKTALINEITTEKNCLNVIWTLNNIRSKSGWLQKCGHLINLLLETLALCSNGLCFNHEQSAIWIRLKCLQRPKQLQATLFQRLRTSVLCLTTFYLRMPQGTVFHRVLAAGLP